MQNPGEKQMSTAQAERDAIELRAMARPTHPWELKEREPGTGRYKREGIDEIMQIAKANRRRLGVPEPELRNQLAGSFLGRLRLAGEINARQYAAGERWGAVVARYARLMGIPCPSPKSPLPTLIGGGDRHADEALPDEAIARIRRDYADAFAALLDCPDGRAAIAALKTAVIADRPARLGDLRSGLNVLCRLWR
jgi:hypothetical protein